MEIWKEIVGTDGKYKVSCLGRICSTRKLLSICFKTKYPNVVIYKNKIRKTQTVHRLVAQAFIPNPNRKKEVNHKNGIKHDNRVENLEWVTGEENRRHALLNNLCNLGLVGCKNPNSKLTKKDVIAIRIFREKTGLSHKKIAKHFNIVGHATISRLLSGKSYKNII